MHRFTDNRGRDWTVAVTVATAKRVKSLTGVDLLKVLDGDLIEQLTVDPILLVDVLYAVCQPQANQNNINDEDFGAAMAGDAISQATKALLDGIIDFFPTARAQILRKVLQKYEAATEIANTLATKKLDDPTLEAKLTQTMEKLLGDLFTDAPESSV